MGLRAWKRWPRVMRPAWIPRISRGTTWSPCSITIQCTGRTNWAVPAPQRMRRAIGSCIERGLHDAGQELCGLFARASRPAEQELALGVVDACELIDRDAAGVGESGRGARRFAGGVESGGNRRPTALDLLLRLAIEQLRDLSGEAPRREIRMRRAVPRPAASRPAMTPSRKASPRATRLSGGISSAPISTRKSWRFMGASSCGRWPLHRRRGDSPPSQQWKTLSFSGGEVGARDGPGERAYAQDVALAFGDGNRLACIEQIENVRGLEHLLVRGQRQRHLEQRLAVLLALVEFNKKRAMSACSKLNADCSTSFW